MTLDEAKMLMQSHLSDEFKDIFYCQSKQDAATIIPVNFDFRKEYKNCTGKIVNQGKCSAGYAIATVSMVSDRLCMATGKKFEISAQHIISCDQDDNEGCTRGYVQHAYNFINREKPITEECLPYANGEFVNCSQKCSKSISDSGRLSKLCGVDGQESIKREILTNGPVVAGIQIHDDFLTYKEGIYNPAYHRYIYAGTQIVKIIGWGEEGHKKYWIIENSWGEDWGENGYAKIEIQDKDDLSIGRVVLAAEIQGDRTNVKEEPKPEVK